MSDGVILFDTSTSEHSIVFWNKQLDLIVKATKDLKIGEQENISKPQSKKNKKDK